MTNNEICKGCPELDLCSRISIKDKMQCPCMNCIVKSMCNNACEEFQDYMNIQESIISKRDRSFCEGDI